MSPDDFPVFPSAFFPGLVTQRFCETWDFYTERLGFRTIEEGGTTVRLLHPCGAQLLLVRAESGDTPAELVSATEGRGQWLTLEVADAAAEIALLTAAGLKAEPVAPAAWIRPGSFVVRDPNGVLVVIAPRVSSVQKSRSLPELAAAAV